MKFSKIFLLGVFYLFALVKADLNDDKKAAINKLDTQVEKIKKLAEDTSVEVEKREGNIKFITKHVRELGDGIIAYTNMEIKGTAKTAYIIANLLGSSNDVFRCIEYREREGLEDSDKYYSQKFLDQGRDFETRAEEYQRKLIKTWKDDYYKAINEYSKIYERSVNDIQKASSGATISSIVRNFEQTTNQMANIVTVILPNMAKTHIQVMTTLDQLVNNLRKFAIYRVEETSKAIQKCFPIIYQKKIVFNPKLF